MSAHISMHMSTDMSTHMPIHMSMLQAPAEETKKPNFLQNDFLLKSIGGKHKMKDWDKQELATATTLHLSRVASKWYWP